MRVLFINYNKFVDSSGIHIFHLANQLVTLGVPCTVCIPAHQEDSEIFGSSKFDLVQYRDLERLTLSRRLHLKLQDPILHAWTPRENVRRLTMRLSKTFFSRYYIHMEDNEEYILESEFNSTFSDIQNLPRRRLRTQLRIDTIDPNKYKLFINNAAGATCIIDTLGDFIPDTVPKMTFWPACEPEFYDIPMMPSQDLRRRDGLPEDETLIGYTGNMHLSNANDITRLCEAVGSLNDQGYSVKLLRTGTNCCPFTRDISSIRAKYVIEYGSRSAREIREIIASADILVQPGEDNNFNRYRFPSKLPMYLASGRPVILPRTNLGNYLENGHNCLLLKDSSVIELVDTIKRLITNPELRFQLGTAGRRYASDHFSWEASARSLLEFYADTRSRIPAR